MEGEAGELPSLHLLQDPGASSGSGLRGYQAPRRSFRQGSPCGKQNPAECGQERCRCTSSPWWIGWGPLTLSSAWSLGFTASSANPPAGPQAQPTRAQSGVQQSAPCLLPMVYSCEVVTTLKELLSLKTQGPGRELDGRVVPAQKRQYGEKKKKKKTKYKQTNKNK